MNGFDRPHGSRVLNVDLPAHLAERLKSSLPGWAAQVRYQPELSFGRHQGPSPDNARPAAVLILLYPREDHWHIPLILRTADMPDHAGQVSLPGGVIEAGESSRDAALREFTEELGAPSDGVQLLGRLSPLYLFASNYTIAPWVGAMSVAPSWNPNRREVDAVLEVPLSHLVDPANTGRVERRQRGLEFSAPCFRWQSQPVWGATSMILAELLASLSDCVL
jgi:8-oxo-dGTP pyrophosphatase MutT (NUDIX family)